MWLRQVFATRKLAAADLLYSRIPVMLTMGQFAPLPFADRPLPALARRPAGDPAAGPTYGPASELPRADHPFQLCRRRLSAGQGRWIESWSRTTGPPPSGRRSKSGARAPLDCPRIVRSRSMPAGSTSRRGSTQILALAGCGREVLFLLVGSEGDGEVQRPRPPRLDNVRIVPWARRRRRSPPGWRRPTCS